MPWSMQTKWIDSLFLTLYLTSLQLLQLPHINLTLHLPVSLHLFCLQLSHQGRTFVSICSYWFAGNRQCSSICDGPSLVHANPLQKLSSLFGHQWGNLRLKVVFILKELPETYFTIGNIKVHLTYMCKGFDDKLRLWSTKWLTLRNCTYTAVTVEPPHPSLAWHWRPLWKTAGTPSTCFSTTSSKKWRKW